MPLPDTLVNNMVEGALGFALGNPSYAFEEFNGRWFYVRGFSSAIEGLRRHIGPAHSLYRLVCANAVKGYIVNASAHAQTHWSRLWPQGDWARCSGPQINDANSAKRMRFDKAWLAVGALGTMCETIAPAFDWAAYIRICPAVFLVTNFDKAKLAEVKGKNEFDDLCDYAYQQEPYGIEHLAQQCAVTLRTATRTSEFLNNNGYGKTAVVLAENPVGQAREDVCYVDDATGLVARPPRRQTRPRKRRFRKL